MATKTSNVTARVEPEVKEQAETILSDLGIPVSTAINIFYRQIVLWNGLPFRPSVPAARPKSRSEMNDAEKYPDRVIYGSESYPRAALLSWQGARDNVNVIGDFVWTAWDYIGEVGVGRWEVSAEPRPSQPAWPWLTANCGDFDLLGRKRPQSYYRDVIWGNAAPHIFCLPPELVDKHLARLSWAWLPVQRNYTFPGCEGQDVEVNIYADADEVELLLIDEDKRKDTEERRTVVPSAASLAPKRRSTLRCSALPMSRARWRPSAIKTAPKQAATRWQPQAKPPLCA